MTKAYSVDDELFFISKNEAFDALYDNKQFVIGQPYYQVDCERLVADYFASNPDFIIEHFDAMLCDIIPDDLCGEVFSNVGDEARRELQQLLVGWIDKHIDLPVQYSVVGESELCRVTSQDIQKYHRCVKL